MDNYLEPEFAEVYGQWKADPSKENNAKILNQLSPAISGATRMHVGDENPLIQSRARRMALGAIRTYDPTRSRLKTHITNQLRGLKRVNRKQSSVLSVPERVSLDRYNTELAQQELADDLGRDPSLSELADRTGPSIKRLTHVRGYSPAVAEGTMRQDADFLGAVSTPGAVSDVWQQIVYDEAAPIDKKIMEWSLGIGGRKLLSNAEIARRLKRSPGAISQRKQRIQDLLDQEDDLSPF